MTMFGYRPLVALAAHLLVVSATQVCSPNGCMKGVSSSPLILKDAQKKTYLTPGTYAPSSDISSDELNALSPMSSINTTTAAHIGNTLFISFPASPVFFDGAKYDGSVVTSGAWGSAYLPDGYYALVAPGKALWGNVADSSQIRVSASTVSTGLSTCGSCASGGVCTQNGTTSTCVCKQGWTGSSCDQCAEGYYGAECTACTQDCSVCDDGLSGTGLCIGTQTTPAEACNCAHGTCTTSGDCTCAAGYVTNTTISTQKCSTCAESFFQDENGNCLACPLGCSTCSLKEGTADTATCTSCVDSLQLSRADTATCISPGSCDDGQYYDSSSQSCKSCSPACTTCTGPSSSDCLACAAPRMNLAGSCVGFSASNGVCDSSLSGLQGVFIANNHKERCDACPAGCAACSLPSYSSAISFSSATCQACQDGYLLESGKCVPTCSEGYYLSGSPSTNGTCKRCDSACTACIGTSTTCTKCPTPSFASNGACISLCPSNTLPSNGTCLACSPDCATCSSTRSSSCLTCPSSRPVLSNGRCLDYCPKTSYFDTSSSTCMTCDTSCAACTGSSSSDCSLCPEGSILKSGKCSAAACKHVFVPGLGVCLEDMVKTTNKKYLGFISLVAIVGLGALAFWTYIRWSRRRTREATQEFAEAMDEREVSNRLMILRLEKVLGLDRLRPHSAPPARLEEEDGSKIRERKRLRELLLLSRRKREGESVRGRDKGKGREHDVEGIPLQRHESMAGPRGISTMSERKVAFDDDKWFAPPPPYVLGESTGAGLRYSSKKAPWEDEAEPSPSWRGNSMDTEAIYPTPRTKITSMGGADGADGADSPKILPTTLRPPPRPAPRAPVGSGPTDGRDLGRKTSLRNLWPALPPSPVFGLPSNEG